METNKFNLIKEVLKNFFSEMIGTAVMVFLGCMGLVKGLDKKDDHKGAVLSCAFAVFIAVQITCHNSGGHINPAVTFLSLFFKKISFPMAAVYICGQITGAVLGFGLLKAVTPSHLLNFGYDGGLCTTVPNPNLTTPQAVLTEFVLTSILMLIVCSAWDPRNTHYDSLTIKFAFTIYSLAYAGTTYTGCSMNPVRSFGPALWNNTWDYHWVYWVAPLSAALFCGFLYTTFFCPIISKKLQPVKATKSKDELEMGA